MVSGGLVMKCSSKKFKLTIALLVLIGSLVAIISSTIHYDDNFKIIIENQTSKDFDDLYINYILSQDKIDVPKVNKKSTLKMSLSPKEKFTESMMKLYYKDSLGNTKDIVLLDKFYPSTKGTINIIIYPEKNSDGFIIKASNTLYEN